jgi:hypothetical protein
MSSPKAVQSSAHPLILSGRRIAQRAFPDAVRKFVAPLPGAELLGRITDRSYLSFAFVAVAEKTLRRSTVEPQPHRATYLRIKGRKIRLVSVVTSSNHTYEEGTVDRI